MLGAKTPGSWPPGKRTADSAKASFLGLLLVDLAASHCDLNTPSPQDNPAAKSLKREAFAPDLVLHVHAAFMVQLSILCRIMGQKSRANPSCTTVLGRTLGGCAVTQHPRQNLSRLAGGVCNATYAVSTVLANRSHWLPISRISHRNLELNKAVLLKVDASVFTEELWIRLEICMRGSG
jgi:hypothetical protein